MTNNNFDLESKMKRQSSLQASASPTSSKDQPMERQSSEADTVTMTTTTNTSTPLHSTSTSPPLHSPSPVPASPFRLMREESVDGTLSPVSFKGGMDTLDNDTTGRRKVRGSLVPREKIF